MCQLTPTATKEENTEKLKIKTNAAAAEDDDEEEEEDDIDVEDRRS